MKKSNKKKSLKNFKILNFKFVKSILISKLIFLRPIFLEVFLKSLNYGGMNLEMEKKLNSTPFKCFYLKNHWI
jgi:hypothetical protein